MSVWREHIVKPLTRSPKWRKRRKIHITAFPLCVVCGKKGSEVHHVKPFHLFPHLELESTNMATMCRKHHFIFGHLENWKLFNDRFWHICFVVNEAYRRARNANKSV